MNTPSIQQGTITALNVAPETISREGINGGRNGMVVSLSTLSTVPYVELVGADYKKTFSWGETVVIPPNMECSIKNASYHRGDIVLSGGPDYGALPARVTVPVTVFTSAVINVATTYTTTFACDTRRARRAFLVLQGAQTGSDVRATINGYFKWHSHNTVGPDLPQYISTQTLSAATDGWYIPLGFGNSVVGEPHALGDWATVAVLTGAVGPFTFATNAYYVLEY